jgi:hypothetical protein
VRVGVEQVLFKKPGRMDEAQGRLRRLYMSSKYRGLWAVSMFKVVVVFQVES